MSTINFTSWFIKTALNLSLFLPIKDYLSTVFEYILLSINSLLMDIYKWKPANQSELTNKIQKIQIPKFLIS